MNCPGIVSLIDRRLWHPLTWNYVPADPGVWLFAPVQKDCAVTIIPYIKKHVYIFDRIFADQCNPHHDISDIIESPGK